MSEFMGNLAGVYDAKANGFVPGSASLHSCMTGHGPDKQVFEKASNMELKPEKIMEDSMSFMFETAYIMKFPNFAIEDDRMDLDYIDVSDGFNKLVLERV
jgi:homogentisate 1,2-dioxygenase